MWECKWIESLNPYKSNKIEKADLSVNGNGYIEFKHEFMPYCVMLVDFWSTHKFFIGNLKCISNTLIHFENYIEINCPESDKLKVAKDISISGLMKGSGVTLIQDTVNDEGHCSCVEASFKVFECTKMAKEKIQKFLDGE